MREEATGETEEMVRRTVALRTLMEVKDILDVTLAYDGFISDQASQPQIVEQQMAAEGLKYYRRTLSTGWFIIKCVEAVLNLICRQGDSPFLSPFLPVRPSFSKIQWEGLLFMLDPTVQSQVCVIRCNTL